MNLKPMVTRKKEAQHNYVCFLKLVNRVNLSAENIGNRQL